MVFRRIELNDRVYLEIYVPDGVEQFKPENGHPAVLILPGGGYSHCSEREMEPIAFKFLGFGFAAAILHYSVGPYARHPRPLSDAAWGMKTLKDTAEMFHINPEKIAVVGFSAGGHLAACLSTMYNSRYVLESEHSINRGEARPAAAVLCYPVISGVESPHMGSFANLLGTPNPSESDLFALSCEQRVTFDTPPTFIWHTSEDKSVPVMNSLIYAQKLAAHEIPFEMIIYERGGHGLSTADKMSCKEEYPDIKEWTNKAAVFLKRRFEEE